MRSVVPRPGLVIERDTRFEPGVYRFARDEGIVIAADEVEIDGAGAVLLRDAPAPDLPDGDYLYTPGDLGLAREEHLLRTRSIEIDADMVDFEYRYWGRGEDAAVVSVIRKGKRRLSDVSTSSAGGGWLLRRFRIDEPGSKCRGPFRIEVEVPAESLGVDRPSFYDGFRLTADDRCMWSGDARDHWDAWYNTGFSIFRRKEKRFFGGVAIRSEGRRGVRLRNLAAHGFLTGLKLVGCRGWVIEDLDLGDNYHDPDYGWGNGVESCGAVYLEDVHDSVFRRNRASNVWNGLTMRRCSGLVVERNTINHCSNACLKMSQSTANIVSDNDFSWGIRKYPEEVHARDSVCLLVESGSDDNVFSRNDFSHGGDGIFIRVLNSWCSRGNLFEANDCSYANNNAIEAWSPGNVYRNNKATRSSYGFWLGGSDDTVLIGNEITHNGTVNRNAPEPFGNAGVAVVHGSANGFIVEGNLVAENRGPGIAFSDRTENPARNWLIVGNTIRDNRNDGRAYRGHGILAGRCRGVRMLGNVMTGNEGRDILLAGSCEDVVVASGARRVVHGLRIVGEEAAPIAGDAVRLRVTADDAKVDERFLESEWDFGDGTGAKVDGAATSHVYSIAGRVRVDVFAESGSVCGAASTHLYIRPPGIVIADCARPDRWRLDADGESVLRPADGIAPGTRAIEAYVSGDGIGVVGRRLDPPFDPLRYTGLAFFYRYGCELPTHTGKRNRRIEARLLSGAGDVFTYTIEWDVAKAPSEDRYAWVFVSVPWERFEAADGSGVESIGSVDSVEFAFGPDGAADTIFALDAVTVMRPEGPVDGSGRARR